jgi:DNA-binding response OmpR family regulator
MPGRKKIIIVDDDRETREMLKMALELEGYEVSQAANGLRLISTLHVDRPDLILLDVMMPGLDGWEVARRLAADESTQAIPIVFLTARAGEEDRHLGQEAGAVGYVVKPFDPVAIATVVELTLARLDRGETEALRREITSPHDDLEWPQ